MANKTSKYLPPAVVVLVILIIAGVQLFKQNKPASDESPAGEQQQNGENDEKETLTGAPGAFEGTLKISDNLKRGNLMLITPERAIYLFTSRDYSALLDKEVHLEIEGTLENFSLVDIRAK